MKLLVQTAATALGTATLVLTGVGAAHATGNPSPTGTGQPNQSCEDSTTRPGNAVSAPGSAFNPDGMAGTRYAGELPQNSVNEHSVSQYDVACFHVSR